MILGMINNAQIVDMVAYRRHAHGRSFVSAALCVLLLSFCCLSLDGASVRLDANNLCYANGELVKYADFSTRFTFNKEHTSDIVSPAGSATAYDNMPSSLFPRTYTTRIPDGYDLSNPNWVIVDIWVFNDAHTLSSTDLETKHLYKKYNNVGSVVTVDGSDLFGKPPKDFAFIAPCFEWLKYKLYYDMNIPNHLGPDLTEEYIYTNTVHLTTSINDWTRTYYTLEGLSLSSNATEATYQFGQTITSAGSRFNATTNGVTLYAVWKPREITMTLDAGEGMVSPSSFVLTGEDKCPALPDAVREGYTFDGWFIGDSRIVQDDTIDDMTNITLTARYTINRYDVTFDENYDGGDVFVTNIQYGVEMPVPQDPERSGWSFLGWEPVPDVTVPASNVYYRAHWIADVWHDATFAWQNDDGETNVVVSVREGYYAEVPGDVDVNELTGRSFADWDPDPTNMTIISNTVFTAQYTNNIYEVVFDANGGVGGYTTNLEYGAAILPSAPEVTKDGWSFVAWEPKPESVGTTVPASNVTFTAQWSKDIYYDADFVYYDGSVVVTNNENRVKENNYVTVPDGFNPDARIGYSFTGWDPPDPTNTPITSNTVFTAQYTNNVYDVVFDANGGEGGVTNYLDYASTIERPTVTRVGSSFVAWEPEPDVTVPASNVCYVAQYTNNIYEVIFDANGGVGGYTTNLEYNAAIPSAPDVSREGFVFVGWIPEPAGTVPASNVCYVAQWTEEKITYGDLATAADANFELTRVERPGIPGSWSVDSNVCFKGVSSIKAIMQPKDSAYSICITGVVHGVGLISFRAKSSEELQYRDVPGSKRGLRFGYGTNPSMPGNWMSPEPLATTNEWKEFTIQIGEKPSDVTVVWWYVYQDVEVVEGDEPNPCPEFNIWLDDIKWTPEGESTEPTEADRPVVSGFSASSGGGFTLSIENASASFDYVVRTNATLSLDVPWGEMKRVSGDQAGSIELERPAGVPSLFYRVGVEAKKQDD